MTLKFPAELRYLKSDEYLRLEGGSATIGISDYAQDQLNDIVFMELPDVGAHFAKGVSFGTVESVKAASDLIMPVGGTVTEINTRLKDEPELINASPYGDGWMIKITVDDPAEADDLLDAAAYEAYCKSR
jgi:glycine cleavage system H protein